MNENSINHYDFFLMFAISLRGSHSFGLSQTSKSLATPLDKRCILNNAHDGRKRIRIIIITLYFKPPCFFTPLRPIFFSTLLSKTSTTIIPIIFYYNQLSHTPLLHSATCSYATLLLIYQDTRCRNQEEKLHY